MADKIVSWGGFDSKGTSGMGVTGSLIITGLSSSTLLEIDSPASNNILFVSGSGRVGIGTATDYGFEVSNTSSLQASITNIISGYATGSAAVKITPHIYATAGNRTYYSMYIGNPGITISGSFGSYDFKSLVTAGGAVFNGGILAGDSRFYATSNAVSFQGYNPYNGQTGDAAGGITFTNRQVAGSNEAGIGAYYGNGSRLYIYNKYNASDSKIIFSVGGTIRSSFFGTGNLSIGNEETDMSARVGIKGSGTTSSTTALLVQNANASSSLQVKDDGSIFFGTGSITYGPTSGPGAGLKISLVTGWATAYPVSIGNSNTLDGYVVGGLNQGAGYGYILGNTNTVNVGTSCILGYSNTQNTYNGTHIMIGWGHTSNAYTNGQNASILIGQQNSTNGFYGGGLIGSNLKYYANGQLAFGGNSGNVNFALSEIYFGNGVRNENIGSNSNNGHGPNISINTSQAYSGSDALNRNGGSLSLRGGQGTGTGSAGDVIFTTAVTGSDGATYHTYTNRVWVKGHTGFVGIGTSSPSSSLHVSGSTIITDVLAIGTGSIGSSENTLTLGARDTGSEGGQIGFNAPGGTYTSASFIDNFQNQFRILKGTNAGSVSGIMVSDLQTGNTQFTGAVTASAFSGLPNDYLYATRSGSNQTVGSAWANTDIIFNNVAASKGISFSTTTGVASLTGGKVYRVTARLAWSAATTYNLQFSCYTSANTQIGPTVEIVQSSNGTNNISDGTLEFIYAPGSNTDIKIRCTANNTALLGEQVRADLNTQFIIQQIA